MSCYRFIAAERAHHPVRQLCQVLGVPASGYYAWQAGQQRAVGAQTPAWEVALVKVFGHHKRRYGTSRLQVALRQKGHRVGRQRLRTAMRRRGLRALQPKANTPRTTDSTHGLRCAPNRLLDQPKPTQANQVWVSDITYLPLADGRWACLCAFQDAAIKHVVGWHVAATMPEELVLTALQRTFLAQPPTPELIVHSDRGGQYCGNAYRALLHQHGAVRSQSRRGECYDNAQAENRIKVLEASGRALKRKCSNYASGPYLPIWPTRRPASRSILTIIITSGCTPALVVRRPISLTNTFFQLPP
ncbi:hypothetical protein GCM10022408_28770 [Hymenobacter fastidiosus]|uniref:Integrase catalytic domain-containing protein n=1 Tax=Hymenobacter fastidiosus TaxID=486264 RepID=A0ABP7SN38_9BACT